METNDRVMHLTAVGASLGRFPRSATADSASVPAAVEVAESCSLAAQSLVYSAQGAVQAQADSAAGSRAVRLRKPGWRSARSFPGLRAPHKRGRRE